MKKYLFLIFLISLISCGGSSSTDPKLDTDFDGIPDISDTMPEDTDNDGINNDLDEDDDGDGVADPEDAFPYDPTEWYDSDNDGTGNNTDNDDDNDGVLDTNDAFALNNAEWEDTNGNGIGNNTDNDDDGDGILDIYDGAPKDPTKAGDHDGDGFDSIIDTDDDNDGYLDAVETKENSDPLNALSKPKDSDSDGLTDLEEASIGTDPKKSDTDGDSLSDPYEIKIHSNPNEKDSDQDGLDDYEELGSDQENPGDYDKDNTIDILDSRFNYVFRAIPSDPEPSNDRYGGVWDQISNVIYVTDSGNNNVYLFSFEGKLFGQLDDSAHPFNSPNDIAIGKNGNIYVADTGNHQVQILTNDGQYLSSIGGFNLPRGIFVDKNDQIFVADTLNHRVQILDAAGYQPTKNFGVFGDKPGQFKFPEEVVVNSQGEIIVADTGNNRVQIFSTDIKIQQIIDGNTIGKNTLEFIPRGLAVDASDNIYITDQFENVVMKFDKDGNFITTFGAFFYPTSINIRSDNKFIVVDGYQLEIF